MVVKNPWDVRNVAKFMGALAAFIVAVSAVFGFAYGQVKNQLESDFYTREEGAELAEVVKKNAEAISGLTEAVNNNSLNAIKRDIADIREKLADLKQDEHNWTQRDRDYYDTLTSILNDLEKEKARVEDL